MSTRAENDMFGSHPTRRNAISCLLLGLTGGRTRLLGQRTSPAGDIKVTGRRAPFSVDYGRPLESVMYTFARQYGWRITYEDAPIVHSRDMVDVTRNPSAGVRVFIPRGGKLTFSYELGPSGGPPESPGIVLQAALAEYNFSGMPGRYALIESKPYLHIVPRAQANRSGTIEQVLSPLDALVTITQEERTIAGLFRDLVASAEGASGRRIMVAWSPFGRGDPKTINSGFEDVSARAVLRKLVSAYGGSHAWSLLFDPGPQVYYLSIQ